MKHVRMLGLVVAMVVPMTAGCRSDDDPIKEPSNNLATGGAGPASGTGGGQNDGGTSDKDSGTSAPPDSGTTDMVPEIAGTYFDGFSTHQIAEGSWRIDTSIFHITILDNAQKFLIASNDMSNDFNKGKWSRFDWARGPLGDLYYCQIAYAADTQQLAEATPRPNTQDLTKGCGSFSWTKLVPLTGADAGN